MPRERVEPETVLGCRRKNNDAWEYLIDPERKIGYVRLTKLTENTARDLSQALEQLHGQGMKGLILDLRFSPGGLLRGLVSIGNMFIKDGVITTIRGRNGEEVYRAEGEAKFLEVPMVCLVNGETAGTSELLAACLQDHHRATIVGERSTGTGYIHTILAIGHGEMTFPMALFYRPNGKKLDRMSVPGRPADEWGVVSNQGYELEMSAMERKQLDSSFHDIEVIPHRPAKELKGSMPDRQLAMALELLGDKIKVSGKATH